MAKTPKERAAYMIAYLYNKAAFGFGSDENAYSFKAKDFAEMAEFVFDCKVYAGCDDYYRWHVDIGNESYTFHVNEL